MSETCKTSGIPLKKIKGMEEGVEVSAKGRENILNKIIAEISQILR
jgi:hypothetical protein